VSPDDLGPPTEPDATPATVSQPVHHHHLGGLSTGMRWTILVFLMFVIIAIVGGIFDQPRQVASPGNCSTPATTTTSAPPQ
jgi:hypothetical protein